MTNLHTHGLHVSPNTPSDNVLILVSSSQVTDPDDHGAYDGVFSYRYDVPESQLPNVMAMIAGTTPRLRIRSSACSTASW